MRAAVILCVALALAVAVTSTADVSDKMSYQGVLRDSGGDVVADGTYDIVFSIYNVATGGDPLWQETQSVSVAGGIMNVLLGSVMPLGTLDFDEPYWLGIDVEGFGEMSPRVELATVPYAARAVHVDNAPADSDWVIDGDNMYAGVSGRVGIGDTDPEWPLDIYQAGEVNTYLQLSNGISSGGQWSGLVMGVSGVGEGWISYGGGGSLHVGGGAASQSINIDSDGRVTVGLEAFPDREMAVYGDFETFGFKMGTDAVAGYVLTCDENGVGTWQPTLAAPPRSAAGNVTLDARGEAQVELPEHLSGAELRYQLTCVGGFAPVYVAEKAVGGVFVIAGGERGMEVSWQVTSE